MFQMIEAYFDESGTHAGSPMMSLAGYLFEAEQARHLDHEWADVLNEFGITTFHMSQYAQGVGEFANLEKGRRTSLIQRLIGIIRRRMRIGIAVSVVEVDFVRTAPSEWKGGAYAFCVLQSLMGVVAWAERSLYQGTISYFFETGHRHQKAANYAIDRMRTRPKLFEALRYDSHAFVHKAIRPLQAADFLAYEWNKEMKRITASPNPTRPMRRSLESLLTEQTYIQKHFPARLIETFFAATDAGMPAEVRTFEIVD